MGGDGIQSSTFKNSSRILISLFCINKNNLTKKYSASRSADLKMKGLKIAAIFKVHLKHFVSVLKVVSGSFGEGFFASACSNDVPNR